jgi:phage-related protein
MDDWRVIYYISPTGDNPIKDFLDERPTAKIKALRLLTNVTEFGLSSIIPHIKKLTGTPLWEIRILGQDSIRILYVTKQSKTIVLLHAFDKKTDKTPHKEIKIAIGRLNQLT